VLGGLGINALMEDESILQWMWKVYYMSILMCKLGVSLFEKGYEYKGHGNCFLVSFDFNILTS
jgi:hypothetical protein